MIDYRLYLVTDDPSRYAGDWIANVVAAVEGGVTCVQYRDTESAPETQRVRILRLRDALRRFGTPLVVNNDPDLAAAVCAEGVHVGQRDMPVAAVRRIVGAKCAIGLSITSSADLARLAGASRESLPDCLGVGPVFDARRTKADAAAAMGLSGLSGLLAANRSSWNLPTVAIGGIALENAAAVYATGVGGIAVVSAFSKAEDPRETARRFRRIDLLSVASVPSAGSVPSDGRRAF